MIEISNKLLSEVLGISIDESDIYIKNNYIYYAYCRSDNEWINASSNIYEFIYKGKEWALGWKYTITPIIILSGKNYLKYIVEVKHFHNPSIDRKAFEYFRGYSPIIYNSEQEAIIEACEWIYKEINK